jgi:hypothetical protein
VISSAASARFLEVSDWLRWFAARVLEAQADADRLVRFLIEKARLLRRLEGTINPRQEKVLLRMFAEGPTGFQGGMSTANYTAITGAASATVTRDLADLVDQGVLRRSGERKATRYWLVIADAGETRERPWGKNLIRKCQPHRMQAFRGKPSWSTWRRHGGQ